jgi:hypothetical protein
MSRFCIVEVNCFGDEITDKLRAERPTPQQIADGAHVPRKLEGVRLELRNADGTAIYPKQEEVDMTKEKAKKLAVKRVEVNGRQRSELYVALKKEGREPTYTQYNQLLSGEQYNFVSSIDTLETLEKIAQDDHTPKFIQRVKDRIKMLKEKAEKKAEKKAAPKKAEKPAAAPKKKAAPKKVAPKKAKDESENAPTIATPEEAPATPTDDPTINAAAKSKKRYAC